LNEEEKVNYQKEKDKAFMPLPDEYKVFEPTATVPSAPSTASGPPSPIQGPTITPQGPPSPIPKPPSLGQYYDTQGQVQ
jgi:hypothetical protein